MIDIVQFLLVWSALTLYGMAYRPIQDSNYTFQWQLLKVLFALSVMYIW